jgi:hypothetical protein
VISVYIVEQIASGARLRTKKHISYAASGVTIKEVHRVFRQRWNEEALEGEWNEGGEWGRGKERVAEREMQSVAGVKDCEGADVFAHVRPTRTCAPEFVCSVLYSVRTLSICPIIASPGGEQEPRRYASEAVIQHACDVWM